ncbi:MAG TPA: hypothetical protein PKD21_09845, partial [Candidatus Competibacter phosphatis]|nr:hypothetical protein [Candidatus Competibacter phosphatis]
MTVGDPTVATQQFFVALQNKIVKTVVEGTRTRLHEGNTDASFTTNLYGLPALQAARRGHPRAT